MERPKNFLFLVVLFTVVAFALAAAFYATRPPRPVTATGPALETSRPESLANPVAANSAPAGTPSAAAQKRAKDFNDATNRFTPRTASNSDCLSSSFFRLLPMIIATFPTYTQVLPGFEQAIGGLRDNLLPLMSVLMICSLIGVAKEGYRAILFHLILLTILVGLAANWQPWFQKASTAVTTTFTGDQYDLAKQTERYLIRLQVKAEQKDSDEGYVEASSARSWRGHCCCWATSPRASCCCFWFSKRFS